MTQGSSLSKLMLISSAMIILFAVCVSTASDTSSAFGSRSAYGQMMPSTGPVEKSSDWNTASASLNLTGIWSCDNGGRYYIRQVDDTVAWLGESEDGSKSSIAFGRIGGSTVELTWMDVPRGSGRGSGSLILNAESDKMTLVQETGGFDGRVWTKYIVHEMTDLKMAGKSISMNASPIDLRPEYPDLLMTSNPGKPSSGIERVSLNPQPEPPIPPIDMLKRL